MPKLTWESELTAGEVRQMAKYDDQIAIQTHAVAVNPDNLDLAATLAYLKYKRYNLQSKAAARLKRRDLATAMRLRQRSLAAA